MIEVYLFYLMFVAQILVLSVLYPRKLIGRLGEMRTMQAQLRVFRWLNHLITFAGVVLLGWLVSYMQDSAWDDGPVETLVSIYFFIQLIPLTLCYVAIAHFNKLLKQAAAHEKRTASLKPRRLFDFVSPLTVAVAALLYPAFVGFVVMIEQDPFPGFAGYLINVVVITLLYVLTAVVIRMQVYGKKANPYQSHQERMRNIGINVKIMVYSCIAGVLFLSLNFTLVMLDLQSAEPLALSIFFVFCAFLYFRGLDSTLYPLESLRAVAPASEAR